MQPNALLIWQNFIIRKKWVLQQITTCRYKGLLYELVMLCYSFPVTRVPASSAKVSSWLEPLLHLVDHNMSCVFPHTSEQDSQPTTSLISMQAIPYRTHGSTCCPRVSTPKTQSFTDSSMTTHNTWRNPTISTIPNLTQITASNLTTVISYHNGWKTNTPNTHTMQTQHHKDGKTYTTLTTAGLSIANQVWTQILEYEA
jgi:hypothetical protein